MGEASSNCIACDCTSSADGMVGKKQESAEKGAGGRTTGVEMKDCEMCLGLREGCGSDGNGYVEDKAPTVEDKAPAVKEGGDGEGEKEFFGGCFVALTGTVFNCLVNCSEPQQAQETLGEETEDDEEEGDGVDETL